MTSIATAHEPYRLSGGMGLSIIAGPVFGAIAAPILGVLYAYSVVYVPLAGTVSVLLTFALTLAVGTSTGAVLRATRCRSTMGAVLVGLGIGVLTLYSAWAGFVYVLLDQAGEIDSAGALIALFTHPAELWEVIGLINETGWCSIGGSTPSGTELWVFWAIEAAIILLATPIIVFGMIANRIFCERCDRWCIGVSPSLLAAIPNDTNEIEAISALDSEAVERTHPYASGTLAPYLCVVQHACSQCDETNVAQVQLVQHELDKKGKVATTTNNLSHQLLIPRTLRDRIQALAEREAVSEEAETEEGSSETQDGEFD